MRSTPIIIVLSAAGGLSSTIEDTSSQIVTVDSSSSRETADSSSSRERKLSEMRQLLFPNQTKNYEISSSSNFKSNFDRNSRSLSFNNVPYSSKVLCQTCDNLQTCQILNTLLIQEVYYPSVYFPSNADSTATQVGTCEIIEQRGIRIAQEIFGPDKTFRDTATCRGNYLVHKVLITFDTSNYC